MQDIDRVTPSLPEFEDSEFEDLWKLLHEFEDAWNRHPDPRFDQLVSKLRGKDKK